MTTAELIKKVNDFIAERNTVLKNTLKKNGYIKQESYLIFFLPDKKKFVPVALEQTPEYFRSPLTKNFFPGYIEHSFKKIITKGLPSKQLKNVSYHLAAVVLISEMYYTMKRPGNKIIPPSEDAERREAIAAMVYTADFFYISFDPYIKKNGKFIFEQQVIEEAVSVIGNERFNNLFPAITDANRDKILRVTDASAPAH